MKKIPSTIGPWHVYRQKPSTMEYGYYYDAVFKLPFAKDKRHVRIWIPESYDFANPTPHPVMYMSDGQNLVDRHLSAYGDWHLDRVIRDLAVEGYPQPILVGIDCPKDPLQRSNELNPPFPVQAKFLRVGGPNHPIANQYIDYIVDELKPQIDELLCTDKRVEATAIGGSSMGGIMSFYGFLAYPETFGYAHAFSPPFFFYKKKELKEMVGLFQTRPDNHNKVFLYVGGKGFEHRFVAGNFFMKKYLESLGFGKDQLGFAFDRKEPHHEEAWYKYSYDGLRFWLGGLR